VGGLGCEWTGLAPAGLEREAKPSDFYSSTYWFRVDLTNTYTVCTSVRRAAM
jgi:hypothetical protein